MFSIELTPEQASEVVAAALKEDIKFFLKNPDLAESAEVDIPAMLRTLRFYVTVSGFESFVESLDGEFDE